MTQLPRAYIRQPSGLHLNLLSPSPDAWTDTDLAISLSRTFRWGGHSIWPLPLSVAQHSLTVMAIASRLFLEFTTHHAKRELLHDCDEGLIGGFDPVSPIKQFLGSNYKALADLLQQTAFTRYQITPWSPQEHVLHKQADITAAASEALHVAGWSALEISNILQIHLPPLAADPLTEIYDSAPWTPWTPDLAAERFYEKLQELQQNANSSFNLSPRSSRQTCDLDCRWCSEEPSICNRNNSINIVALNN